MSTLSIVAINATTDDSQRDMELHPAGGTGKTMTGSTTPTCPQPPLRRASMTARPWAGPLLRRPLRRLLGRGPAPFRPPVEDRRPLHLRRLLLLALVLLGAWVGTSAMADVLPNHGQGFAEMGLLILFGILFSWISAGFWTGLMGAIELLRGPGRGHWRGAPCCASLDGSVRTAMVMPICNEHVPRLRRPGGNDESLVATGEASHFDVVVLSDTGDPDIRAAEQAAWNEPWPAGSPPRRADPQAAPALPLAAAPHPAQAGNVADFCRRWGADYRYFVVLDADSVMTGECLATLVRMMEADPCAGIIQTAPTPSAARRSSRGSCSSRPRLRPALHRRLHFWQLGEPHYWGHNAILRIAPFMRHCALAPLPARVRSLATSSRMTSSRPP